MTTKKDKKSENTPLHSVMRSKFVRSVIVSVTTVFLFVAIAVTVISFLSFSSELNRNVISTRQRQLAAVEDTVSSRMAEVESIAYNIGVDNAFLIGSPIDGSTGYEMSDTLSRYLVGNDFIEYLAFCRLSEPDTLYTSRGEIGFRDFWSSYVGIDRDTADIYISQIQSQTEAVMTSISIGGETYFSYTYPLPLLSKNPTAFVLMMISADEVKPLLETQFTSSRGTVAVFNSDGSLLYSLDAPGGGVPFNLSASIGTGETGYVSAGGVNAT